MGKKGLLCPECLVENPKGSLFCNSCGAGLSLEERSGAEVEALACPKCDFRNPERAQFCLSCGTKLVVEAVVLEGLAYLNMAAGVYVLASVVFNTLVRASFLFLGPYLVSGGLTLYVAYALRKGKVASWTKYAAVVGVGIGLVATFLMFLVGLALEGIVGPMWLVFLLLMWKLWKDRHSL
ncbi:MAG: zinc ribbon domain-containing protein [Candidatus Geothermarchaeales archaeon]